MRLASTRKPKHTGVSSVLVAVGGEKSDDPAVRLACQLLNPHRGNLYIVYVIEVERSLPIDAEIAPATARGEEVLNEMEALAEPYKLETAAELLQSRRTGLAVVQEAVDKQVDAIVLGVPYKEVYGSFSLGDMVPYVLKNAPCRVILSRDSIPEVSSDNGYRP